MAQPRSTLFTVKQPSKPAVVAVFNRNGRSTEIDAIIAAASRSHELGCFIFRGVSPLHDR